MEEKNKVRLAGILHIVSWVALAISIITFLISLRSENSLNYVLVALGFWVVVIAIKFWRQKLLGKKFRL